MRRGAARSGRARTGASHFHAHGGRIVTKGGVIIGFKRGPWFARFGRLAWAVRSAAAPNLHRVDHIDFGEPLASYSRPSSKAHSFGRGLQSLGNVGGIRFRCVIRGSGSRGFRAAPALELLLCPPAAWKASAARAAIIIALFANTFIILARIGMPPPGANSRGPSVTNYFSSDVLW